jgi:HSP20 family protein
MSEYDDEGFFPPTLRGEVDAFFRQALGPLSRRGVSLDIWSPQLDVTEEDGRFILEIDLPGVRREDVSIKIEGRVLVITGTRKIVRRTVGARYSHCERVSGSFRRTIPLPREIDEAGINAALEEGILRVELPKKGVS